MKVICISKDPPEYFHPDLIIASALLTVGEVYTVIDKLPEYYELAEFTHATGHIFWSKKSFKPLSSADESVLMDAFRYYATIKLNLYENRKKIQTPNRRLWWMPVDHNSGDRCNVISQLLRYHKERMPE